MYKVSNECIRCGLCEAICPDVFEIGDEDIALVLEAGIAKNEESADEALESCPVNAITKE